MNEWPMPNSHNGPHDLLMVNWGDEVSLHGLTTTESPYDPIQHLIGLDLGQTNSDPITIFSDDDGYHYQDESISIDDTSYSADHPNERISVPLFSLYSTPSPPSTDEIFQTDHDHDHPSKVDELPNSGLLGKYDLYSPIPK